MKRNNKKGFTITELVIVIAVIAILAAVLIPTFSNVISNAKQSAALQTCSNAMKDYSALAAQEGKSIGTGMVFVNDGFVFVYVNSSLHYVGELKDLDKFDNTIKYVKGKANIGGSAVNTTDNYTDVTLTLGSGENPEVKTITKTEMITNKDSIYLYTTKVNGTTYFGFFTLESETANDAQYKTQGALYSRLYGASDTITVAGTEQTGA